MKIVKKEKQRWFTPSEISNIFNVSKKTIYRRVKDGGLAYIRIGRQLRISRLELLKINEGGVNNGRNRISEKK